jgi:hypothetical protein
MKLTEDEVVKLLMKHLEKEGWNINSFCLGQKHGTDIIASKSNIQLIVEAKGAKASESSPTKKRDYFDSGQIKTHFGKAIVKILEEKHKNPKSELAIAHPNDTDLRKTIGHLLPYLKTIGIKHFWISANGSVTED